MGSVFAQQTFLNMWKQKKKILEKLLPWITFSKLGNDYINIRMNHVRITKFSHKYLS